MTTSTPKPRVLVISTNSDEAGAPLHVETLVRLLSASVEFILLFGEDGPVFRRLQEAGFDTRILPGMRSSISPKRDLALVFKLTRLIREIGPDLIHCHSSKAGLLGRIAGRWCKVPVVFTIHGWSWDSVSGRKAKLALAIERMVARLKGVRFIYVCKAIEQTGQRQLKLQPEQGVVIYNGVPDLAVSIESPTGPVRYIMPARVAYPKDHETLVRAFESAKGENRLLLCGAATDATKFADRVTHWAPRRFGDILCLGHRQDIPALLHGAHVMVLSSRSEAMPLSIIEAMSAGLPVIASNVGGIGEQISDGENGFLVPPGDVAAMASALEKLMDPDLRKAMGLAGRARYEAEFTSDIMAKATLDCYRDLISRRV